MTRRIAITILLTVAACIICAGSAAWVVARAILLQDLDNAIAARASTLPAVSGGRGGAPAFPGDRFVVRGDVGQTLDGLLSQPGSPAPQLRVTHAAIVDLPDGPRRVLELRLPDAPRDSGTSKANRPATIIYSASAAELERVLQRLAIALVACGAAAAAVAALVSVKLARVALRPLGDAAEAIGTVDETNLDRRVDHAALPPELRPLAAQLNRMLGRLQGAFEQRRRFVADASHELRTPTAAMITTMEVALRRARSAEELEDVIRTCLAEARHMRSLVQALLRQVRAELESPLDEVSDFDASALVSECATLAQSLAREKDVRLVDHLDGALTVRGEPMRLRSVVMNLLSNAIEYNRSGGSVEVSARAAGAQAEIRVTDDGPGIPAEHVPHLFQPFYRASRNRKSDGHLGLGLFLVESHVKAMGGECRVETALGAGTTFLVRMPLAARETSVAAAADPEWEG